MNDARQPDRPPVLIAEDDHKIADLLANYLQSEGWQTELVGNGLAALTAVRQRSFAVLLLDVMLPGLDGMEVCRRLREFSSVPVIMLTARVDESDRLQGLDAGADDYVCKPFSPREVAARVRAQWRRVRGEISGQFGVQVRNGFTIHEGAQRVLWQGRALDLTTTEFRLLRALLVRPGTILSRAQLQDALHADYRDTADRTIDSHVRNVRRKLEAVRPEGSGIVAVYGAGYRFEP